MKRLAALALVAGCSRMQTFPPAPSADPSISVFSEGDGSCEWRRVDPLTSTSSPILRVTGGCKDARIAWSIDAKRALAWFPHAKKRPLLALVALDTGTATETAPPETAVPASFRFGFGLDAKPRALAVDEVLSPSARKELGILGGDVNPQSTRARIFRHDGSRWIETSADDDTIRGTAWPRVLEDFRTTDYVTADSAASLALRKATGGQDRWLRAKNRDSIFYAFHPKLGIITAPVAIRTTAEATLLLEGGEPVAPEIARGRLFLAVGVDGHPRLYDLATRRLVYSDDRFTGATLWP